ncbi:hypothetical protein HII26_10400 [Paenibacillus aquistagni]|nr:hypothetical protein [Paenibacillus aquistagni]
MSEFSDKYNPNPSQPRITTSCLQCKYPLALVSSLFTKNKHGNFCCKECYFSWRSTNLIGKANAQYKRTSVPCDNCQKLISLPDYKLKNNQHNFCCKHCYWIFRGKHYIGQNSYWFNRKRPDISEQSRTNILKMYKTGTLNRVSIIQKEINTLLERLGIEYEIEKTFGYYSVDHFLTEYNLIIETMGDYWHANPNKYRIEDLNKIQLKDIHRDKRKQTYIKKNHNVDVLYLWENEITYNLILCEFLIQKYILNKGGLKDYHSFNYWVEVNSLHLKKNIVKPLWIH